MKYRFKGVLTNEGWLEDAVISTDATGIIQSIAQIDEQGDAEQVNGFALPGFQNAHSHAFQYAMAGMAELHAVGGQRDDFWSWRKYMYELALSISPDQLEHIATMLYAEMVRHGYTSVAEFHYLHHDPKGKAYDNLAEMGERLVAAAQRAGIKITLVPMYYQLGGFNLPAEAQQRRFLSRNKEAYYDLLAASEKAVSAYSHARLGMGIHSLRAVNLNDIIAVGKTYANQLPFHIHISEQLKEVAACLDFTGQRPVEWLLNHVDVTENFHLVHATHLNDEEVSGIAKSGARVVICPTTEGNLGDGRFSLSEFQNYGGQWSIGTDSHVSLNPLEELRTLDYGQRIHTHNRDTFCSEHSGDSGMNAITMACLNGRDAMGHSSSSFFAVGQPMDAVVYDASSPLIGLAAPQHRTNTILYSSDQTNVLGTLVDGQWIVKQNNHQDQANIQSSFVEAITALRK